jgi:cellulose biosynthesis protein BcsQ
MMQSLSSPGPGVIVVAEPAIHTLLVESGASWRIQERQGSIGAMWDSLSGGRLDEHSSILVFSDALAVGSGGEQVELVKTARAIVAMSHAGARVFIAVWRPTELATLQRLIDEAAQRQGVHPSEIVYHLLPAEQGGKAVLSAMRRVLVDVDFPLDFGPEMNAPLATEVIAPAASWPADATPEPTPRRRFDDPPVPISVATPPTAEPEPEPEPETEAASIPTPEPVAPSVHSPGPASTRPALPPISGAAPEQTVQALGGDYPPAASAELLSRPKVPGQVTITVTSSKGGSGKSTASILLAGSISRASADAGTPLSVCLIDLDTRDGQVASLIGKFMPTALNIRIQPVWDEARIRRNLVRAHGLEVDTLLAPIRPRTAETVGPDFYRTIIRSLQRMYDVIVMDTSVQYLDPLIAQVALPEADEILFVTTLASTAVQGMARALREITAPLDESGLGIAREKIGILVNQSVANVGMERDQVLAAGLGVPVVGVIPLATKDVLTATNLNRMFALLDHPLIGPAYNDLARACLPGHTLAPWRALESGPDAIGSAESASEPADPGVGKRGLFRR